MPEENDVIIYLTKQGIRFAAHQSGVEQTIHCPNGSKHTHGDASPSASVNLKKGVLKCHVPSCGLQGKIDKLWRELGWKCPPWLGSNGCKNKTGNHRDLPTTWKGKAIKEWYRYESPDGSEAFEVARVEHQKSGKRIKEFPVYCKGGWGLSGKGVEKVLYRLPEIVKATDVFIVEGEKDVHTLEKMGMVATTSPFGAGKFLPEFAKYFNKSHHVVIIPDNDKPGRDHAEQAAAVLNGHVGSLKILTLANLSPSGDVSDWAEGRDPYEAGEELCKLAEGAPEYQENGTSECLWTGQILTLEEAFKRRQEREYVVTGLIALPSLTIVYGPPGSLKTFLVADLAISVAGGLQWLGGFECGNENRGVIAFETTRHTVLCLDFDNGRDRTEERLAALARDRNLSVDLPLRYVSMPSPWLDASSESQMDELEKTIERVGAKLVIVDNLCVVSGKVEENSAEMGTVMANWRRLAEKLRIAILIVHHQTKGNNKDSRPGNSLRGHSSIEASLDLALQVEREGQSDIIRINPTKVRGADVAPFGARFTYEHLPGTDILEKARFFGHEAEDVSGSQVIEEKIMEVLREHLSAYGAPNKSALTVKVQKELNAKPGNKTPIGVNRIRGIIDVLEAEDKLSVTPGKQGAKLYCLPNGK